jgi:hypothetical protein
MPAAPAMLGEGRSRHAGADDNSRNQCRRGNTLGHNATSTIIVLVAKRLGSLACSV